ncbi:MAG: IS4 family transposase [Lewinellaceae bacterium]|nr:IS4 family transposase [Lewinellaceae bacterium]
MNDGTYVFSQLMGLIHRQTFARIVEKFGGNERIRTFSCWHQLLCMSFGQLTHRESLRDVVTCLNAHPEKLYHMGLTNGVKRSTLADANEVRDYRIYEALAHTLIAKARKLYQGQSTADDLDHVAYALDSTTVELCLDVFWWAKFRKHKAAVKLHTLFDIRCEIPCFVHISDGKFHDVNVMDILEFEPDAFYVMDRGYTDWTRLKKIHDASAFFVIRAKKNLAFERIYSAPVDKTTGLRCDQTGRLKGFYAARHYPGKLRRIKYVDPQHQVMYVYLTNHFEAKAAQIVHLYMNCWKVELFFKWIKQHLRIKRFWGESANAVKTQIWIAICTFVLVAIWKHKSKSLQSMNELLQITSVSIFEKKPVNQLFNNLRHQKSKDDPCNQLNIFDL